MCGIAFIYEAGARSDNLRFRLQAALAVQHHRGPDQTSVMIDQECGFGHNRLSIVDLSGSTQPMESACGRYVIIFNGEIYNFKPLREALKNRWTFRTCGDTEVLMAGLVKEGVSFLSKAEGMWAFLLWDRKTQTALAARDRFGKKPLHFIVRDNQLQVASEISALKAMDGRPWQECDRQRRHYFKFGYMEPGTTIYHGVRELRPGESMEWHPIKGEQISRFFSLQVERFRGSHVEAQVILRDLLARAVEKRLVADVEVGVFLSGGIDSSLIASIAKEYRPPNSLKAFSIGFTEKSFDESAYYRQMASYLKLDLFERQFEDFDSDLLTSLVMHNVGQPFHDSSLLPTYMVSKLASEHVKVVLTGDGADEIFCGYERYRAQAIFDFYQKVPAALRKIVRKMIRNLDEPRVHHSRSLLKKLKLFIELEERYEEQVPYVGSLFFTQCQIDEMLGNKEGSEPIDPAYHLNATETIEHLKSMMLTDVGFYMPQDILVKVDRATMAASIEARSPFLDSAVVEFAASLPVRWLLSFRGNKKMLRRSFYHRLPHELWYRRKQGFGVPLGMWFDGALGGLLNELITSADPLGLRCYAKRLLDEHRTGRFDHAYRLWILYTYLRWKGNNSITNRLSHMAV